MLWFCVVAAAAAVVSLYAAVQARASPWFPSPPQSLLLIALNVTVLCVYALYTLVRMFSESTLTTAGHEYDHRNGFISDRP